MTISTDDLAAYADGELTGDSAEAIRTALETDAELRTELDRLQALKSTLSAQFDQVLDEPVPDDLIATAMGSDTDSLVDADSAEIVDFGAARPSRLAALTSSWPQIAAMAASLAVGVIMGGLFLSDSGGDGLIGQSGNGLAARGQLAAALTGQIGDQPAMNGIALPVTFRDDEGHYCRAFAARSDNLAGIACREGEDWQVRMMVDGAHADAPYRTASSTLPLSVLESLDLMMAGEALDADAERAAQTQDWRD